MLALALKNGWVRAVQADLEENSWVLNGLQSRPLPSGLISPDVRSSQLSDLLQDLFQETFDSLDYHEGDVYLSLGEEWAECLLLEGDSNLSSEENERYFNWILEQRKGPIWDKTVAFFQNLSYHRILTFLMAKNLIDSIKSALDSAGAVPKWMEPSVQSVGRVITSRQGGTDGVAFSLEPHGREFRLQCYDGGELKCLADLKLQSGKFRVSFVRGDSMFAGESVTDLNRFIDGEPLKDETKPHLFLVGEFPEKTLKQLQRDQIRKDRITVLDPFLDFKKGEVKPPPSESGSWFVDIFGLLLLSLDR